MRGFAFIGVILVLFLYTGFKIGQTVSSWTLAFGLALLIFIVMLSWQFLYRGHQLDSHSTGFAVVAWSGGIVMGVWAIFVLLSLPVDFGFMLWAGFRRMTSGASDPSKRALLTEWIPVAFAGIAGGMGVFGLRETMAGPKIHEKEVPIPNLALGLRGLTIVQISDLHVGPTIRKAYVERVVKEAMALKPDLIAVTGDLIDGEVAELESETAPLAGLQAPLGVFYVTGNHEYYWGAEKWVNHTRKLGFLPLQNENRVVEKNGAKLLVAGVNDLSSHSFEEGVASDPKKAAESDHSTDLKLLLAHRPGSCYEAEKAGFDLQLSGHTHAGQFFPWNFLVAWAHPYYRGLNRHGKMWVYVNAGTGYWGPPMRLAIPSEITLLRLVEAPLSSRSS